MLNTFGPAPWLFIFKAIFFYFFGTGSVLTEVNFYEVKVYVFKAGSGSALRKTAGSASSKNKCVAAALAVSASKAELRIRILLKCKSFKQIKLYFFHKTLKTMK